jgi:WD40 repeat protein
MASESGQMYLFDIESSQLLNTYTSHAMCVRSLTWSPDGQVSIVICFMFKVLMFIRLLVASVRV